jgi:hypothetical protein
MDRQPGWRLAIIVWGLLCPAAIDTGAGLWVLFVQGSRVPWFTLPETAAYSMIAAMPMAVLTARSVRRRGKIIPRAGQGREGLAWITIGRDGTARPIRIGVLGGWRQVGITPLWRCA